MKEFEGKETAQLVDRYKFLDLYPCSTVELKSIGYSDVSGFCGIKFDSNSIPLTNLFRFQSKGIISNKSQPTDVDEGASKLPKPDFSQMVPYKPKANAYFG